jgi:cystathionine beta-synthase
VVDRYVQVSDRDSFVTARAVTQREGILVGGSGGTAVFAALEVARDLDASSTVVVLLPDGGRNYLSKLYSDTWMLQHGMLDRPDAIRVEEVLSAKGRDMPPLVTVGAHDKVRQAVDRLKEFDISQAPVVREDTADVSGFVGSIRDRELLERIFRDPDALQADVAEVMAPPIPMIEWDDPVETAFGELEHGPAVLVTKAGQVLGVLTRSDLLDFLAHRRRAR